MKVMKNKFMDQMGFTDINRIFENSEKNRIYSLIFGDDDEKIAEFQKQLVNTDEKDEIKNFKGWQIM